MQRCLAGYAAFGICYCCRLISTSGYRAAYEEDVIHRDMSVENILINKVVQIAQGNRGFIIDFDHAKMFHDLTLHDDPISVCLI